MRSMFTLEEVAQMLDMTEKQVNNEVDTGQLGYTYEDGEKRVTLYDLEKYMGAEQAMKITREFLAGEEN
ncbi:MAG: hypothetical protein ACQETE_00425 [Bacteroidota bacterium]